jgi:hypothetical protein
VLTLTVPGVKAVARHSTWGKGRCPAMVPIFQ